MPCDSTPLIFWGLRLQSSTTSLSCSCSLGTKCTRPLTTVRGSASPTSIFSTYRLSASGCCQGEQGWQWGGTEGWQTPLGTPQISPRGKVAPLSLYLFHADHFAHTDVQPGWDHVLWLRVLGALLCRLCRGNGMVTTLSTNPERWSAPNPGPGGDFPSWNSMLVPTPESRVPPVLALPTFPNVLHGCF